MCDNQCGSSSRSKSKSCSRSGGSGSGASALEQALMNAQSPIETSETAQTSANGVSGIFLNKQEVDNWKGSRPIGDYPINNDPNPQVIKKSGKSVNHVQQINVRFLKAPAGQAGPIIIKQEAGRPVSAAPPIIIRQQCGGSSTPAPKVIREAPPKVCNIPCKTITIPGPCQPPPPRKVIIEKIPAGAAKPGNICVDRWLAPAGMKRKVIFKPAPSGGSGAAPKNVIIEWSAGQASVSKQVNNKGISDADPEQYRQQYGSQLVTSIPAEANVPAPSGYKYAADAGQAGLPELEGDLEALALVDLDAEGLGEYKQFLASKGITPKPQGGQSCGGPKSSGCGAASRSSSRAQSCGRPKSSACGC